MMVQRGTNSPTEIYGRYYSGYSLDQMQGRGYTPSTVEDIINNYTSLFHGNKPDTWVYQNGNGRVVTNGKGNVITVISRK